MINILLSYLLGFVIHLKITLYSSYLCFQSISEYSCPARYYNTVSGSLPAGPVSAGLLHLMHALKLLLLSSYTSSFSSLLLSLSLLVIIIILLIIITIIITTITV